VLSQLRTVFLSVLPLVLASACDGQRADEGADALLSVGGGTCVRGPLPAESAGPKVQSLELGVNTLRPGATGTLCAGALDKGATAVALALRGDRGYFVVRAKKPALQAPESPTFEAPLGLSGRLPEGTYELLARAIDESGQVGPLTSRPVIVQASPIRASTLRIQLRWEGEADLDLRLTDPTGVEISHDDINAAGPVTPGSPADPNASKTSAILDFDSNAQCVFDGRNEENVLYRAAPPSGAYVVRVDATSMCGAASAPFTVSVLRDNVVLAQAKGSMSEADTRFPSERGSGLKVLEFAIP
jgi:hypothetical protein